MKQSQSNKVGFGMLGSEIRRRITICVTPAVAPAVGLRGGASDRKEIKPIIAIAIV